MQITHTSTQNSPSLGGVRGGFNPGNIRHSRDQWQGMAQEQPNKSFVSFQSLDWGYRAMWKTLETYYTRHQCRDVYSIIHRWAPERDHNNTRTYIAYVCRYARVGGRERLTAPMQGAEVWIRIITAMTCVEQGIKPAEVDTDAIRRGYKLAW